MKPVGLIHDGIINGKVKGWGEKNQEGLRVTEHLQRPPWEMFCVHVLSSVYWMEKGQTLCLCSGGIQSLAKGTELV